MLFNQFISSRGFCAVFAVGLLVLSGCQTIKVPDWVPSTTSAQETPEETEKKGADPAPLAAPQVSQVEKPAAPEPAPQPAKISSEELGLGPDPIIGFIETTSMTLLKDGQIDFPVGVDVDIDASVEKLDLDEALDEGASTDKDLLIIVNVALAKASRRVTDLSGIGSTYFWGYLMSDNTKREVGPSGMANGIDTAEAQSSPYTIGTAAVSQPIFLSYEFSKATMKVRKVMTVHYYVIDTKRKTVFKSTFDVSEEERFNVGYDISNRDPKRKRLEKQFDTEKDVDDFEKASSTVRLSQVIRSYQEQRQATKPYVGLAELRRDILKDKNRAIVTAKANTFDTRPLNDPRFDSVVAVYRSRGMGSGFFVKPDVVMTNWHVVKDQKYVEMKMYDGRETFGRVLGKDVRLDIALVKVQDRGKPVKFYTKKTLDLGRTTEAIGHPKRLEFSITRGIVSAIRNHASINLPRGAGDKVLYVQTDAPINSGNSGGPLFVDNEVVGMNTWGIRKYLAEGLNFSVHYSELLKFMNEHLPGFHVNLGEAN